MYHSNNTAVYISVLLAIKKIYKIQPLTFSESPEADYSTDLLFFKIGCIWGEWSRSRPGRFSPET
jgi:hypothetical protein